MSEKFNRNPNTVCDNCGKPIYIRPNRLNEQKTKTCSKKCDAMLRSKWFRGENNHQYGLKGTTNATYKGKMYKMKNWYKHIRVPDHPFAQGDFVREHRLVAEKYHLNDENSITIDGKSYLKSEYDVHHINGLRIDNRPENLKVMTRGEHSALHNRDKKILRDSLGRIKSSIKK